MPSYQVKQSSTAYPLIFLMIDSSDHISGKTGLSPTVTISKAGGSFASPAGSVTEIGSGWYKVAGNATDSGTLGPLALHATSTGADPSDNLYEIVAHDVQDAVHLGLSALPNAAAAASGGLIINGSNSGTVTLGALAVTGTTALGGNVSLNGTLAIAGLTTFEAITVTSGLTVGAVVAFNGGFNVSGSLLVSNALTVTGAVTLPLDAATLARFFTLNTTKVYADAVAGSVVKEIASNAGGTAAPTVSQIATAVWQDATAGDFTVASSIGKALYIANVAPGGAGGHFIAGSNAATTIAGLTTGALACTTITVSGAVAFQSTFAVTTSTSLGALSCTTLTASGAVALQSTVTVSGATTLTGAVSLGSTLGVTGTTTLAALNTGAIGTGNVTITGTLSTSGTTTFNALTVSNVFTVSGATTLTGAVTATNASNDVRGIALHATQAAYAPALATVLGTPAGASIAADLAEIEAETDGIAAIPTTPVTTAHFDTIMGTPVISIAADIAEVEGETDTLIAGVTLAATQSLYAPAKAGDAMTLTAAYDLYSCDIILEIDAANVTDKYEARWFKNGIRITSGITSPTIQVVKRSDGTDLIASTAMTQVASTGAYKKDALTTARLTAGESADAIVSATIDGSTRTFSRLIGRDST